MPVRVFLVNAMTARIGIVIHSYQQALAVRGLSEEKRVEYRARLEELKAEQARRIAARRNVGAQKGSV